MGRPSWKIRLKWIFLISLYPISLSNTAVPIDIVTEKVKGDIQLKPKIIPMIPEKEPLIVRRQWWWPAWTTWRTTTTTKRYALFLKYYDSHYEEYYDTLPFLTAKPKHSAPGLLFGFEVAKAQVPPLLLKMVTKGGMRMNNPRGSFRPPRIIHIPEEIENYTYVAFHHKKTRH